jgi:hypothetical protein
MTDATRGRMFNTADDGFMLEFGSSLAAVEAAFEPAESCGGAGAPSRQGKGQAGSPLAFAGHGA